MLTEYGWLLLAINFQFYSPVCHFSYSFYAHVYCHEGPISIFMQIGGQRYLEERRLTILKLANIFHQFDATGEFCVGRFGRACCGASSE